MNAVSRYLLILITVAAVVAVWLGSVVFIPHMASYLNGAFASCSSSIDSIPCTDIRDFGLVGDMFGSINALFSGLALGAIALTLWIESRSRRESRKPLVIGSLAAAGGVEAFRPCRQAEADEMRVEFNLVLQNQTVDAALNVLAKVRIAGKDARSQHSIDEPLLQGSVHEAPIELKLYGGLLDYFLAELTAKRAVDVEVITSYRSLEGINWQTSVVYELTCREGRDIQLFNAVRDNTWTDCAVWPEGASVAIECKVKSGSWNHRIR